MSEAFLTNTSTEGLKPRGTAPQRSYELVSETVRDRLGDAHAALFAEPVPAQYGDRIDWYATVDGHATPLDRLADAQAARSVLARLVSDIKAAADELLNSKQADDQRLGEALANALEIPDEGSIYIVISPDGDAEPQPVVVNWAWAKDEQQAVRGILTGIDRRKQPAMVAPAPPLPTEPAHGVAGLAGVSPFWWWLVWLGWALLALMIGAVAILLIEPCAVRLSWVPGNCIVAQEAPDTLSDRREVLQNRIALAEKELGIKDRLCQPDFASLPIPDPVLPAAPTVDTPPSLPPVPDVDRRAEAFGGLRGDLTFTLIWDGNDDLDLHLTCPASDTLFFLDKVRCNGVMDLDMNGFTLTTEPVENIFFTDPLGGTYRARVNLYRLRDGLGAREFTLQVRDGDRVTTQKGRVTLDEPNWQFTYQYRKK